jgi:hypothetical protein
VVNLRSFWGLTWDQFLKLGLAPSAALRLRRSCAFGGIASSAITEKSKKKKREKRKKTNNGKSKKNRKN